MNQIRICNFDQRPCLVGQNTNDAHWRCGTWACLNSHRPAQLPAGLREGDYPDPTSDMLRSREFEAIWQAIKGWDIQRKTGAGYAGASGNDVRHIIDTLLQAGTLDGYPQVPHPKGAQDGPVASAPALQDSPDRFAPNEHTAGAPSLHDLTGIFHTAAHPPHETPAGAATRWATWAQIKDHPQLYADMRRGVEAVVATLNGAPLQDGSSRWAPNATTTGADKPPKCPHGVMIFGDRIKCDACVAESKLAEAVKVLEEIARAAFSTHGAMTEAARVLASIQSKGVEHG